MRVLTATPQNRPAGNTNTGEHDQGTGLRSAESLFRDARRWSDERGLNLSHSKLSRLVRGYRRAVIAQADRGPVLTLDTYLSRTYADPTGETAVNRVMSRGGR